MKLWISNDMNDDSDQIEINLSRLQNERYKLVLYL